MGADRSTLWLIENREKEITVTRGDRIHRFGIPRIGVPTVDDFLIADFVWRLQRITSPPDQFGPDAPTIA